LSRPLGAGWTKFLARRQANVDPLRRHDSRLRSIFRKHARESALTSLGALVVLFGSLFFGGRPRSRRTQSGKRSSRFAIVIRSVLQTVTRAFVSLHPTNRPYLLTARSAPMPAKPIQRATHRVAVNSRLLLRRLCGGREWGSMQIHRVLNGRRSFVPRSPPQAGLRRATRLARGKAAHNGV